MSAKKYLPPYLRKLIAEKKKVQQAKRKKKLYTESWDDIRRRVYQRDNHRCVMCDKKGKVSAHHIVPVVVSHDNSMSNLITVCSKCHRKLEAIGFKILESGGHRSDVRRVELRMIAEARRKRIEKFKEKTLNESGRHDEVDQTSNKINCEDVKRIKRDGGEGGTGVGIS